MFKKYVLPYYTFNSISYMERLCVILLIVYICAYNTYNMFHISNTSYSKTKIPPIHFDEWTLGDQTIVFDQSHHVAVLSKEYPSFLYHYESINKTSGIVYSQINSTQLFTYDIHDSFPKYLKLSHSHQHWFPREKQFEWYRCCYNDSNQIAIVNQVNHEIMIFDLSQQVVHGRKNTLLNDSLLLEKLY